MTQKAKPCTAAPNKTCRLWAAGFLFLNLLTATITNAQSANESLRLGNAAFRAHEYKNAIQHYKSVQSNPIVALNLGVAYFHSKDYPAASRAFIQASADREIAPRSYYNLGLVARREGDPEEARVWFRQAHQHPNVSPKLKQLAQLAYKKSKNNNTGSEKRRGNISRSKRNRVVLREPEPKFSDLLFLHFETMIAQDSNVYRSPASSYVDLSDPTNPTIDPLVRSGTYIPLALNGGLEWGSQDDSHFTLEYNFKGKFFTESELSNANEYRHQVFIGGTLNRDTKRGSKHWFSRLLLQRVEQQSYDHDDGLPQFVGTEDVSDRYKYTQFGPEMDYRRWLGKFGFGVRLKGFMNRYDDTLPLLNLTHEQYLAGLNFSYRPWQKTLVRLSGEGYRRAYTQRPSKDSNGLRLATNDTLDYMYKNYGLSLRQKFSRKLRLSIDYRFTLRTDQFQGYDDYERHSGRALVHLKRKRLRAKAGYTHRLYNFPNAFAFDVVAAGEKTLTSSVASADIEYQFKNGLTLSLEVAKKLANSTDLRAEYDVTRIALGFAWRVFQQKR